MRFSGHESFQCRLYWLKKGYDFLVEKGDFASDDAPVKLGVGKNMVTSIKYWMRAFGMFNEDESGPSALAEKIFNNETGWDPYLEDEGTLWLMHYQLVKCNYASIYHIIFNQLRKRRPEFNLSHFETWVSENGGNAAINTLKTDLQIFSRIYLPRDDTKDLDETYSGLLTELALVNKLTKENTEKGEKSDWFSIEPKSRPEIPYLVLVYCILDSIGESNSVSFDVLYNEGVGSIFALSKDGLAEKLEEIAERLDWITFSNEAGVKELQFRRRLLGYNFNILSDYYEKGDQE